MKTKITLTFMMLMLTIISAFAQWTTSGNDIYNSNTGNVGVGTTTPTYKLEVVSNGASTEIFSVRNDGTNLLRIIGSGNADFYHAGIIMTRSRGTLASPTELLSNDRIATFAANAYVNGAFRSTSTIDMYAGSTPGVGSNPGYIIFRTTPNGATSTLERMRLTEAGRLGIGTTSPSHLLHVNGDVGATSYITISDKRFKQDIKGIENPLEKLSQIEGHTYLFNASEFKDKNFPEGERTGLIAQEVQKVFPNLVSTDSEGYLGVDYNGLIPVLVEAIKELKKEINFTKEILAEGIGSSSDEVTTYESKGIFLRNYPNPATHSTTIEYSVVRDSDAASVIVHNFQGKEVKTFTNLKGKGKIMYDTNDLNPGIYFYSLIVNGDVTLTHKIIITK